MSWELGKVTNYREIFLLLFRMYKKNVSLKPYTTFKIGGKARYYTEINSKSDLVKASQFAEEQNLPLLVIGGGSNVLMQDEVINAVVIRLTNTAVAITVDSEKVFVMSGAGKNWDELVEEMVSKGYQGIECLSGIPGTVGAAPIQNIGAYGQEIKDTFHSLEAFDRHTQKFVTFMSNDCKFGYRDSVFKSEKNKGRYIVYSVTLMLNTNAAPSCRYESLEGYLDEHSITNPTLLEARQAVLFVRESKLENPNKVYNSGSFFKNPVVTQKTIEKLQKVYPTIPFFPYKNKMKLSAGWLIDNAGWKGKSYKNVGVSSKHALVLINPEGKGTAAQIKELAGKIQDDVREKFGVDLEPEVNYITV